MNQDIKRLVSAICFVLDITEKQIYTGPKNFELSNARFIAVFNIKKRYPEVTLTEIGALFNKTHCFCVNAIKMYTIYSEVDKNFKNKIKKVNNYLELDLFNFVSVPQL